MVLPSGARIAIATNRDNFVTVRDPISPRCSSSGVRRRNVVSMVRRLTGSTRVGRFSVCTPPPRGARSCRDERRSPLVVVEASASGGARRPARALGPWRPRRSGAAVGSSSTSTPNGRQSRPAPDYAVSLVAVLALVAVAMTPVGRPLSPCGRPRGRAARAARAGRLRVDGRLRPAPDLLGRRVPGMGDVRRRGQPARRPVPLDAVDLATPGRLHSFGAAVLARTMTGFLSPVPQGVSAAAKLTQNLVFLLLVLAIGGLSGAEAREPADRHPVLAGTGWRAATPDPDVALRVS